MRMDKGMILDARPHSGPWCHEARTKANQKPASESVSSINTHVCTHTVAESKLMQMHQPLTLL